LALYTALSLLPPLTPDSQFENSLRRHNHVGLAHALLLAMAKVGVLNKSVEVSKEKMKERLARRKETEMDED
jgi:ubiquitin carboxyl-terminal hydrolase L5